MNISHLRRKKKAEPASQKDSTQTILYFLLAFWIAMPVAFFAISSIMRLIPVQGQILVPRNWSTRLASADAKYFYILGVETVCAALWSLCFVLPGGRDLLDAARRRPWHACLAFMLFWSVLSTLVSGNPLSCFWGLRYHNDGLASYFIYAAIYICALFLARDSRCLSLLRAFTITGVFCALLVCWQVLSALVRTGTARGIGIAVFYNTNHCGYYLTMGILCAAGLWLYDPASKWRVWHLVSFSIQVYALILNDTFGCYLAVLLALPIVCVFWFFSGRRDAVRVLIPCVVFLLLTAATEIGVIPSSTGQSVLKEFTKTQTDITTLMTNPEDGMQGGSGRVVIWLGALEQTAKHPLFGLGPDSPTLPTEKSEIIRAHNEFLQHAMLLGIPALTAYLVAIFSLLAYRWKHLREADGITLTAGGVVAGYLISSFFGITIFYTTPFFFFFLGLASGRGSPTEEDAWETGWQSSGSGREALAQTAVLLTVFLFGVLSASLHQESRREYADYANTRLAVLAGEAVYERSSNLDTTYWFDPVSKTLYPTDDQPPEPYGHGTAINGKTLMTGEAANSWGYFQEHDYRGTVLMVKAVPIENETADTTENSAAGSAASSAESSVRSSEASSEQAVVRRPLKAHVDFDVKTIWTYLSHG